jgi:hypothetical protein
LLPISSEGYDDAVGNTKLLDDKVSLRDVEIGDTVLLQNKTQGVYMGNFSLYGTFDKYTWDLKTWLKRQIIKVNDNYFFQGNLKILSVIEKAKTAVSKADAIETMLADKEAGLQFYNCMPRDPAPRYSNMTVKYISTIPIKEVEITYEEITYDEMIKINFARDINDTGELILEGPNGKKYVCARGSTVSNIETEVMECQPTITGIGKPPHYDYYGNRTNNKTPVKFSYFSKFYKIVKHIKNESYI